MIGGKDAMGRPIRPSPVRNRRLCPVCVPCESKVTLILKDHVAGRTGLEPATSGVTGQCSNQLNYRPKDHYRVR